VHVLYRVLQGLGPSTPYGVVKGLNLPLYVFVLAGFKAQLQVEEVGSRGVASTRGADESVKTAKDPSGTSWTVPNRQGSCNADAAKVGQEP
jgi:hypothetical protein